MNKLLLSLLVSFSLNQTFAQSASPTLQDAQNLAEVMSSAREKINPEIPKDKYGRPAYHIGNLGGVPVHLPQGVDYLEYSDSPGWNPEAIKNYDPDVRTYDSVITSFSFEFRNSDLVIYDVLDPALRKARKNDYEYRNGDGWVAVSVSLMPESAYSDKDSNGVTRMYKHNTSKERLEPPYPRHLSYYEYLAKENKYGLKAYINPGINPETKRPWREDRHSEDLFISFKEDNKLVQSHIRCFNIIVPYQRCVHYFDFPPPMKIGIDMRYSRNNLKYWKEYEDNAIKIIHSFQIKQ